MSDLSCYSKSEDDLDTSIILQQRHNKREWKEHRPSGEYSAKKRRSGTQKVADPNNSDRIIAKTTVTMPKNGTITATAVIETIPGDENKNPQTPKSNLRSRRKSDERRSKSTHNENEILLELITVKNLLDLLFTIYHCQFCIECICD